MALMNTRSASLVYTLEDETGSKSTTAFDVPYDTLAAVAIAAADLFLPVLQAITDCSVTGYSLNYSKFESAPPAPAADSRAEQKGVFKFLADDGKFTTYQVPGIKKTLVDAAGIIDEDQLAVAAFVTAITAVDAVFSTSNGANILQLEAAYELFKKSGKRQRPQPRRPD